MTSRGRSIDSLAIPWPDFLDATYSRVFRELVNFLLFTHVERDKTLHNVNVLREQLAGMIHVIELPRNAGEESIKCNYIILGKYSDRYLLIVSYGKLRSDAGHSWK